MGAPAKLEADVLIGQVAALREVRREDAAVLHAAFRADPAAHVQTSGRPWLPTTVESVQAEQERAAGPDGDLSTVTFTVQSATDSAGRCHGSAVLWGIDLHNRTAHLGVSLLPASRGRGLGLDALRLLCRFAFEIRDLYRVTVETLATNEAMRRTAVAAGFVEEGLLREHAYVMGERVDEVVYGLLRPQWPAPAGPR